jgi:hypothetical protein
MAAETLLALWNDTPTRRAIVDFVQAVSTEGSPGFVVPAERVAVFDKFAYTTGAEDALDRAKTHGWTVVSMKEDWSAAFVSA